VAVGDTLARVLPEGIAEGRARRIGEDIFNEIHRTLAADRTLSEQVGEILPDLRENSRRAAGDIGTAEQQRVDCATAGRRSSWSRRVAARIGEWTSSVLGRRARKPRAKTPPASRVDIAAARRIARLDAMRAMSSRRSITHR